MNAPPGPADDRRFPFVQLEYPWALGPPDGRHVVRSGPDAPISHVIVLVTLGAPERRLLRGRRPQPAEPEPDAEPVTTTRATIVDVSRPLQEPEAQAWVDALRRDTDAARDEVKARLVVLNDAMRAHRIASADPYQRELSAETALVRRVGYGVGDQVAEGRWAAALVIPALRPRERRIASLRPQERLAALLAGRERALVCEELLLRARLDLDQGRTREAALQLRVALEAAISELSETGVMPAGAHRRIEELSGYRQAIGAAANVALARDLGEEELEAVNHAAQRIEAALRARSAAGGYA